MKRIITVQNMIDELMLVVNKDVPIKYRYEENIDNRRLRTLSVLQKNSH